MPSQVEATLILHDVQDHSGGTWKCLLKEDLKFLELENLDYTEGGLLVQAEYETAFKALCFKKQQKDLCHGVVLTGQQGSGVSHHP
jgi:hypothetical protein